jgi:hypothetical protein
MPTPIRRALAPVAVLSALLVLAGCASTGASPASSSRPSSSSGPASPGSSAPTDVPPGASDGGGPDGSGSTGGGVPGDPGTGSGIGLPIGPAPVDPGAGQPAIVIPKPGRLNPHPVAPTVLASSVDGRHVLVKVTWYAGVAPCSVLDSVKVARSANTIELTVLEGADEADAICPEIAMLKATIVDLGELEPGTWTIRATDSDAAPVEVTIS